MQLKSPVTTLSKPVETVFASLSDIVNFKTLMPDNLAKFEVVNPDTFRFALSGMPEIALQLQEKTPPSQLRYSAAGGAIPFTLTVHIQPGETAGNEKNTSRIYFVFEGQLNPMMAMMVKNPITHFIETLSKNAVKL